MLGIIFFHGSHWNPFVRQTLSTSETMWIAFSSFRLCCMMKRSFTCFSPEILLGVFLVRSGFFLSLMLFDFCCHVRFSLTGSCPREVYSRLRMVPGSYSRLWMANRDSLSCYLTAKSSSLARRYNRAEASTHPG